MGVRHTGTIVTLDVVLQMHSANQQAQMTRVKAAREGSQMV